MESIRKHRHGPLLASRCPHPERTPWRGGYLNRSGEAERATSAGWTAGAKGELDHSTSLYRNELRQLSRSLAVAARLNRVSPIHVQMAREQLRLAGRPRRRFQMAVGGILIGMSVPNLLLAIASKEAISPIGYVYVVLILASSLLLAGNLRRRF